MARWITLLLAAAILSAAPAATGAQAPDSVFLEDLTWTELAAQIKAGKTTVIVPVGGVEQSGPYMALGKHDVRVRALSERIARALGNAVVAPVIAYAPEGGVDPPTAHMRFPGTITVPPEVFRKTLESAGASFRLHGFRDVVFIGDHGGYQSDLAAAAAALNAAWAGSPARAHYVAQYYRATQGAYVEALRQRGYSAAEIGTHAGLADTSLMLAVDPRLVRRQGLAASRAGAAQGVYGDPRRSSPELGRLGTDAIVRQSVDAIRAAVRQR